MSKETFIEGFCKVANQHGVPPEQLAKFASDPISEHTGTVLTTAIPVLGPLATFAGHAAGLLSDGNRSINDSSVGANLIPGVGAYRLGNRMRAVADEEDKAKDRESSPYGSLAAEYFSPITSTLAATAAGAGLGKLMGNTGSGAGLGLAAGVGANVIGALAAAITKRRKKQEQHDADKTRNIWKKLLLPGVGTYDSWKRVGYSNEIKDDKKK